MSGLSRDFWTFWTGQTISAFGSSITQFALPLLVYQLTGSALDLGIAFAAGMLPYPLFGLLIGVWTDRVDRKRLMILTDIARAAVIGTIPLAATLGTLSVWWIYNVLFVSTTLTIAFQSAEFAAIPALVSRDDLVTANGRIQASFSAASVIGPPVAGAALVLAWSANPLGALVGGYAIERTGDIAFVYGAIGVLTFAIALSFYLFSPLGHAERYLEAEARPA